MNKKLLIVHGDFDGIVSAAGIALEQEILPKELRVIFCQPHTVDKIQIPSDVEEVFVADVAVNNRNPDMTKKFVESLGNKLKAWYDHHSGWVGLFDTDNRIQIEEDLPACAGWFDVGALLVADAVAADTRDGPMSPNAVLIEHAIKGDMENDSIREAAVKWLLGDTSQQAVLEAAAKKYAAKQAETERLAATYEVKGNVAIVDTRKSNHEYDLTQLLLAGQKLAKFAVAMVIDPRTKEERVTIATPQGGINLVELFGLPSGAPFRVSLEASRLPEVMEKLGGKTS